MGKVYSLCEHRAKFTDSQIREKADKFWAEYTPQNVWDSKKYEEEARQKNNKDVKRRNNL